jgi:hypothetical protein
MINFSMLTVGFAFGLLLVGYPVQAIALFSLASMLMMVQEVSE